MEKFSITYPQLSFILIIFSILGQLGWSCVIEICYFRFFPSTAIEKTIIAKYEFYNDFAQMPLMPKLLVFLTFAFLEELVFRYGFFKVMFWLPQFHLSICFLITISSFLFGIMHYWNDRSWFISGFGISVAGIGYFISFLVFEKAFGAFLALLIISAIHFFYNIALSSIAVNQKQWTISEWKTSFGIMAGRKIS